MTRAEKARAMLLAAVPFAFAAIRLATTGNDARYLRIAAASTLGALAARAQSLRGARLTVVRAGASLLAPTPCAAIAALLLGATADRNGDSA